MRGRVFYFVFLVEFFFLCRGIIFRLGFAVRCRVWGVRGVRFRFSWRMKVMEFSFKIRIAED